METISVNVHVSVIMGINSPCMTASTEDIGVVSMHGYTLRQLMLPADETCSMHTA